ncbi:MAG: choline monooxygenase [Saprospirales bacterium]|nr:choline monooxygenase [Saprospirales bacterium]
MNIHPEIGKSSTLPASFYREPAIFEQVKEKVFASSWLYVADRTALDGLNNAHPFTLLPGVLNEPLLLSGDDAGTVRCLSNVCTHRGMLVVEKPGKYPSLRCTYHGRCFHMDGRFKQMPEFEGVEDFPSENDNLTQVPLREWLGMYFVSLNPAFSFEDAIQPIVDRIGWMPLDTLVFEEEGTADYPVAANWALYCDNYLEGFHIPFVHPALNKALDFKQYKYELFPWGSLQLGIAEEGEPCFDIPEGAPDHGKAIYAYYYWLFPNLMLNFYPWGLSLNVVQPLSHDKTLVRFRTYRFRGRPFDRELNVLEKTEMEDEAVVEAVQMGVQSRFYKAGRYSVKQEQAVHHFHRLLSQQLSM